MRSRSAILAISLMALGLGACDEGTPTAPAGAKIFLAASPLQIGPNGTSTITVTVLRSNGQPVNPGTEVRLETTAGDLQPVAQEALAVAAVSKASTLLLTTDERGVAMARLHGAGSVGTATITARSGSTEPETLEIELGGAVERLVVQANPTSVDPTEVSRVRLFITVFDERGNPFPGANVNVTTEAGRLDSQGRTMQTNAQGEVVDTLTINVNAAESQSDGAVTVSILAQGGGGSATGTVNIVLRDV